MLVNLTIDKVMDRNDNLIAASAGNLADWHEASLKPLGIECRRANGLWYQVQQGPVIYVAAVTLDSLEDSPNLMAEIEKLVEAKRDKRFAIIDSWAELDLRYLGMRPSESEAWYIRDSAPGSSKPHPQGLQIEKVTTKEGLEEFEIASWGGFESNDVVRSAGLGGQHHPDTLSESRMQYFVGRYDGKVVTSCIAQVSDDIVGVFGVSTLPEYRNRGFGEAITWAATLVASDLPAHLEPSEQVASMYRKMGYREIGQHIFWHSRKA